MSIKVTLRGAIAALQHEVNGAEIVLAPLPYSIVHPHIAELRRIIGQFLIVECELEDAMGLHEQAPAQPLDELRSVPGAEEESGDQSEPDATPAEDFTLLDPAVLNIDEPVLDATILPQVTPDEVPPTAEVIHTDDGRKRFALFGGQTHEVVSGSGNPDADFWANVLHPKPKVDA